MLRPTRLRHALLVLVEFVGWNETALAALALTWSYGFAAHPELMKIALIMLLAAYYD
jgi:hypothetical protein